MSAEAGRRIGFALATALVSVGLSAGLGESALRILRPQAVGVTELPTIYDRDPELGYRYRPGARGRIQRLFELDNAVVISPEGFHDRPWGELAGPRPIVALGDSFTAALHVPVEETWTRRAGARLAGLRANAPRVLNLGLDGTGTEVQKSLLEENLARLRPQLVLLAFFENDLADARRGRVFRETRGRYVLQPRDDAEQRRMRALADRLESRTLMRTFFDGLYTLRLAVYLAEGDRNLWRTNVISPYHLGAPAAESRGPGAGAWRGRVQASFRALQTLGREHGFQLLVVPVPPREEPGRSLRAFRQAAGGLGLEVFDVQPALQQALERDGKRFADLYWRWDAHFNRYGNECFGEAVADALAARIGAGDDAAAPSSTR